MVVVLADLHVHVHVLARVSLSGGLQLSIVLPIRPTRNGPGAAAFYKQMLQCGYFPGIVP